MKDPSHAIQAAVYSKLTGSAAVKAVLGDPARIYDKVVATPNYPFARIGDDQVVGDSNSCSDGWQVYVTVHIFGRNPQAPRPEVKLVQNAIAGALGDFASLIAPAGLHVVDVDLQDSRTFMEADGLTAHGVMVFRYLVADAA
jgi:hypothetical protein